MWWCGWEVVVVVVVVGQRVVGGDDALGVDLGVEG